MKVLKLQLENFRNFPRYEFDFDSEKNIFILNGPNGIGKTNFLEALYVLSLGKSFRLHEPSQLISFDMDYLRVAAEIEKDREKANLEVFYSTYPRKQKGLKMNGVGVKNMEFLGNLLTVLFHPEDLNMLYLSPILRRRYLNILLSQVDKEYLLNLAKYQKTLKQRNALLLNIREAHFKKINHDKLLADLEVWDQELIDYGSPVLQKRLILSQFIDRQLEKVYRQISGDKEALSFEYKSRILKKNTTDLDEIKALFRDEIYNRKERDIMSAKTTVGPHRDDFEVFLNGKNIINSASRGEIRTVLLALKLIEIGYIGDITGENPILLLDDVFSELDPSRQKHLISVIKDCQTIITTTDILSLGELVDMPNTQIVKLE